MTLHKPQTFGAGNSCEPRPVWSPARLARLSCGRTNFPRTRDPRAIFGDAVEPDWNQRLTITVGPQKADLVGTTDRVIQAAVDYVARLGGGTVRVLPGTYRMRNSVFLQSKVRLLGSGTDSVLVKEPSTTTKLIVDGDHWDQEVTLADPKGFQVGDGVRLVSKDPYGKGTNIVQRTLIASSGNRFKLDSRLHERFHLGGDPQIATNFALLQCTDVADVVIENITLDGNKAHNDMLDRGAFDDGSIRLDSSNRITVRQVTVHDFYCDGIVWGISHDVVVENCHLYDGAQTRPALGFRVATVDRPGQPGAAERRGHLLLLGRTAWAVREERDRGLLVWHHHRSPRFGQPDLRQRHPAKSRGRYPLPRREQGLCPAPEPH